jgi:hypothetical protein
MCHSYYDHDHERTPTAVARWHALTPGERTDLRQRGFRARATRFGWIVVACIAMCLSFQATWPLWVILILGIRLALQARWAYGGGSEDDEPSAGEPSVEARTSA